MTHDEMLKTLRRWGEDSSLYSFVELNKLDEDAFFKTCPNYKWREWWVARRFHTGVKVPKTTVVGEGVGIYALASIGEHCKIGDRAYIGEKARIGNNVVIGEEACICSEAAIGDNCNIGARAFIRYGVVLEPGTVVPENKEVRRVEPEDQEEEARA